MTEIDNNVETKIKLIYHCDMCEYKTIRKGNYAIHCNSKKHKNNECEATKKQYPFIFSKVIKKYNCKNCNKHFNDRAGLWRHNKNCINNEFIIDGINVKDKDALLLHLLKKNNELQNKIMEITSKL